MTFSVLGPEDLLSALAASSTQLMAQAQGSTVTGGPSSRGRSKRDHPTSLALRTSQSSAMRPSILAAEPRAPGPATSAEASSNQNEGHPLNFSMKRRGILLSSGNLPPFHARSHGLGVCDRSGLVSSKLVESSWPPHHQSCGGIWLYDKLRDVKDVSPTLSLSCQA